MDEEYRLHMVQICYRELLCEQCQLSVPTMTIMMSAIPVLDIKTAPISVKSGFMILDGSTHENARNCFGAFRADRVHTELNYCMKYL